MSLGDDITTMPIISADDHLIEPPDLWTNRFSAKMSEQAPRVVRTAGGGDEWLFEGHLTPLDGMTTVAGRGDGSYGEHTTYDAIPDSCYDANARVRALDEDGVTASACFPNWVGFSGTRLSLGHDKALCVTAIEAYNDFVLDEWCGAAPDRLIPVVLIPLWDAELAVVEIARTAAKGAKAIAFSENPTRQGFPSIHGKYWDPVFAAAQDAQLPLCLHMGSSSAMAHPSTEDSPITIAYTAGMLNSQYTLIDWLFSGNFDRFPGLKIVLSEGGLGWVPHVVERCDLKWKRYGPWSSSPPSTLPSESIPDHVYFCWEEDVFGGQNIDAVGADNVLVEVDFPHGDSSWPHSRDLITGCLGHLDRASSAKVLYRNAATVFNFDLQVRTDR